MRVLLIVTVLTTLFYSMTGLVYVEGGFEGALVVKPYPIYGIGFGGGEAGTWARHNPGKPPPWFMQKDLTVITSFSWEEGGNPDWVTAYILGWLATILGWVALAFIGVFRIVRGVATRGKSIKLFSAD